MQRRSGGRSLGAVLFTDIVGSTAIAAEMGNTRWSELVSRHHRILRGLIGRHGGREVDTAGDGFFIAFERPADAIRCAVACTEAVRELGIEIRAGVAFGELETVGRKPSGLVVNTAARVMSVGGAGEVLLPAAVRDIVPGTGITFTDHGVHELKGLEGEFRLFSVAGVDGREITPPLESDEAVERRREIFPGRQRRRGALIAGVVVGALAVVVALIALLLPDSPAQSDTETPGSLRNAVARIDPTSGEVRSVVELGREASVLQYINHPIAAGEGGVWLLEPPLLRHIDPIHAEVRSGSIVVGLANVVDVRTGLDDVWVLGGSSTVWQVNPATDELSRFLVLPNSASAFPKTLAIGDAVWVGQNNGALIKVDPRTDTRYQVETGYSIDQLAATKDHVWFADILEGALVPVDPGSLDVGRPVPVEGNLDQLEARGSFLWILERRDGVVTRVDAETGEVTGTARVGGTSMDMAVADDAVWVADLDGSLYRVDPSTLQVTTLVVGAEVLGVTVDHANDSLWVYVGEPTDS